MSVPDAPITDRRYGHIIVVGGGCYGSYYVRQLVRAQGAGSVLYEKIVVVDRDPACAVAALLPTTADLQLIVQEWSAFFDAYLGSAPSDSLDAIVPSPLMPHLMYEWLLKRAQARWPEREVQTAPLAASVPVPWDRLAEDGTRYVSYATWTCPINCIEPRRCPHTRAERSWSMPTAAEAVVAASQTAEGEGQGHLDGPVIFHCTHRAYGVGMFDTRDVIAGDAFVRNAGAKREANVLVGTVSHCHGALNVLHVGAPRT